MKIENILEAEEEAEAKRFLKKLKEFKEVHPEQFKPKAKSTWFYGSKEGGALRRSSMDLTRSLSKLRNDT